MMKTILLSMMFAAQILNSSAAKAANLDEVFRQTYQSAYRSGECFNNMLNLLKQAKNNGASIQNTKVLIITNLGCNTFGLVNAEEARSSRGRTFETNWSHHVVVEQNGVIYDMDYDVNPHPIARHDYFKSMFLNERSKDRGGMFFDGEKEKLTTYQVQEFAASDLVASNGKLQGLNSYKIQLGMFLGYFSQPVKFGKCSE